MRKKIRAKNEKLTPESIAKAVRKETASGKRVRMPEHIYKSLNPSNAGKKSTKNHGDRTSTNAPQVKSFAQKLIEYSLNPANRDFNGFFRLYQLPYSTFRDMCKRDSELQTAYEIALNNFSYNIDNYLDGKLTPGKSNISQRLFFMYNDAYRERRREDKVFDQELRVRVVEDLARAKIISQESAQKIIFEINQV